MKEIDPQLFVTCRLCLEDTGVYQIVPAIQKLIKFCFDIAVDPFDGLPQLLCKKCEALLSDYNKTKETFLSKQESLRLRLASRNNEYTSTNYAEDVHSARRTLKRKRIISSSSDSNSDSNSKKSPEIPLKNELQLSVTEPHISTSSGGENNTSWKTAYRKLYICKLCNNSFRRKNIWESHFHTHDHIQARYRSVLAQRCAVLLNRVDDRPNMTGDLNTVVYSCTKVIKQCHANYYLTYTINDEATSSAYSEDKNFRAIYSNSDCSDTEVSTTKRRKSRLISKSSRDTMIIDDTRSNFSEKSDEFKDRLDDNTITMSNGATDCINIVDDSSDSASFTSRTRTTVDRNISKVAADEETISNIISLCHQKYLPESFKGEKQNKFWDQLKHKFLSVGKKFLQKRCFNNTGILRYLEWNDLNVVWIPRASKQLSYIHAKIETNRNCSKGDWVKVVTNEAQNEFQEDIKVIQQDTNITPLEIDQDSGEISLPNLVIENTFSYSGVTSDVNSAGLYTDRNKSDLKNKLLNKNPVANPKRLPKKFIINKQNAQSSSSDVSACISSTQNSVDNESNNMCMPIITSTKSLADVESMNDNKDEPSIVSSSAAVSAPRIKVKPVSELMSESTLQNLRLHEANANINPPVLPYSEVQHQGAVPLKTVETSNSVTSNNTLEQPATKDMSYVILDTIEIPNMKTKSPFLYFRDLLKIHNITLLDVKDPLSRDFTCLIKFKVFYNQEAKQQPVVICLSLFSNKHLFCLKFKDKQQEYINIDNISPNWQWELLKLYKGDVFNKVLQNAMKVSQETFNYTQSFLCLLKSINLKTES